MQRTFERRIRHALARLAALEGVSATDFEGVSDVEWEHLEDYAGMELPASYRLFMQLAGRRAGPLLVGTRLFMPEVLSLRQSSWQLLASCRASFQLSTSDYVFVMHQGYSFTFFDASAGDDPPVRSFSEGMRDVEHVAGSFSAWIDEAVGGSSLTVSEW